MSHKQVPIPAIGYESDYWVAENDGMRSRSQMARASGQYKSAVPATLRDLKLELPADLVANLAEASVSVGQFDEFAHRTFGSETPTLGPMSSILLRTESSSSSQIENLTVGAKQLALADLDEARSVNAQTVHRNVLAMEAASQLSDQVGIETILFMHRELLNGDPYLGDHAGTFREQLVWVGSSPVSPLGASFVAPRPEHIADALEDLLAFIERVDLPVLAQIGVAHAQFETIHPFVDGNGRTGRALIHALMHESGLVRHTTVPLSAGLLRETERYFDALTRYRAGDAYPIIELFCDAARYAAETGKTLTIDLHEQVMKSQEMLTGLRSDAIAWRILPLLISHPVINARLIKQELGVSDTSAHRAIRTLVQHGILHESTGKSRGRVWQHDGILRVLDGYAESIRRG